MSTRHLVDPELVPLLEHLPAFDFSDASLPEIRRGFDAAPPLRAPESPAATSVTREEVQVPGRDGAPPVRALVYRPGPEAGKGKLPAVFHVHGGGYIIGKPEMSDVRNRFIAGDLGCVVVSIDYRLAPETAFPGPVEDCYAGLVWLHTNADKLGVDRAKIAIKGESAGGGLAAALALLARDRKEVPIAFQLLVYPMLDDRTGSKSDPSPNPLIGEFVWTPASNRYGWRSMLGGREPGSDDVSPYCAPARATDLAGLPPTFIQVGSLDLFLDEDMAYAHRLLRAGVPTELHVYPGGFHGLDMLTGTRIEATFSRDAHEALRRALKS